MSRVVGEERGGGLQGAAGTSPISALRAELCGSQNQGISQVAGEGSQNEAVSHKPGREGMEGPALPRGVGPRRDTCAESQEGSAQTLTTGYPFGKVRTTGDGTCTGACRAACIPDPAAAAKTGLLQPPGSSQERKQGLWF